RDKIALEFVSMIGNEIGAAMGAFINAFPAIFFSSEIWKIVLVGSVGQKFALPSRGKRDRFVEAIEQGLRTKGIDYMDVERSILVTEDREIVPFRPDNHLDRKIVRWDGNRFTPVLFRDTNVNQGFLGDLTEEERR